MNLLLYHYNAKYRDEIGRFNNNQAVFFFWKGRVALYAILKAMGIGKDDEVILPAYTCVVVPNAILYFGAKPVYVDIESDTYSMDFLKLEAAITTRTKAIMCQNTYGFSKDVDAIAELGKQRGIYTIEDCCHGFGGTYNGRPNGSYCDAAFFSSQWNKPFSTGLGGFAVINRKDLIKKMQTFELEKMNPAFFEVAQLQLLIWFRRIFLNNYTYWILMKLYRYFSQHNFVLGSSQGIEIESINRPKNFFKGLSRVQAREGQRNLKQLESVLSLRKKNAAVYTEFLKSRGKKYIDEKQFSNHSFLKYPILVKDRAAFLKLGEKYHIRLGDWFCSPLHPVQRDLNLWGFEPEKCPVAVSIARQVVNLPTECRFVDGVLRFLELFGDLII